MIIELVNALHDMGITGNLKIRHIDKTRIEVYIDGEYFGIWDDTRKTFVD